MPSEPAYHTWREFLTPEDLEGMERYKAGKLARGKAAEIPWRQIVERLSTHLMFWETDYEPDADARCVSRMYAILEEYEEAWSDLTYWEMLKEGDDAVSG